MEKETELYLMEQIRKLETACNRLNKENAFLNGENNGYKDRIKKLEFDLEAYKSKEEKYDALGSEKIETNVGTYQAIDIQNALAKSKAFDVLFDRLHLVATYSPIKRMATLKINFMNGDNAWVDICLNEYHIITKAIAIGKQ